MAAKDNSALMMGVPDMEVALLGAIFASPPDVFAVLSKRLAPDDFFLMKHGQIWGALVALFEQGHAPDVVMVASELERRGQLESMGGAAYITRVLSTFPTLYADQYADVILEYSARRKLALHLRKALTAAENPAVDWTTVQTSVSALSRLNAGTASNAEPTHVSNHLQAQWDEIERVTDGEQLEQRVPCRLPSLQAVLGGYVYGGVYTIAGRPGRGKTSFAHNEAPHLAKHLQGRDVIIYSWEMPGRQVMDSIMASSGGIDANNVERRTLSDKEYNSYVLAAKTIGDSSVYINDKSPTWEDVRAYVLAQAYQGRIGCVILDQLSLIPTKAKFDGNQADYHRISYIIKDMKMLAMQCCEVGCPMFFLVLSQVSRAGENEPTLSTLAESGRIEQDSDAVVFIHANDKENEGAVVATTYLIVAKNRHGAKGRRAVGFYGAQKLFSELAKEDKSW